MEKRAFFVFAICLAFFGKALPAQDAATLEALYNQKPSNFPYFEIGAVTEMSMSSEGLWEFGRDFRMGSGLHAGWIPSDWVYLAADIQGLYLGGPMEFLDTGGIFAQAEGIFNLLHVKQPFIDKYGLVDHIEDGLLGIELGASAELRSWKDLWDSDFLGAWGNRRWYTHQGTSSDYRLWGGLSYTNITPTAAFESGKGRLRFSLRFVAGTAEAEDTITMASDGSTEDFNFSLPASYGGIGRFEMMYAFIGLSLELGYYRGFHFAMSITPGWAS